MLHNLIITATKLLLTQYLNSKLTCTTVHHAVTHGKHIRY